MKIKSIRQVKNLAGKRVLLRADFNVPIKQGVILDDFKIAETLPTIRFLLRHNCLIIIATHLDKGQSAKILINRLKELLGQQVIFIKQKISSGSAVNLPEIKAKQIILLENLRLTGGEKANDKKFAKKLAGLADIYVNDAFAVSHRDHASVSAVKKYLPAYAGLLLEKEIENLNKVLRPKQPLVSIFGGSKIATKINFINNLAKKSSKVLIGGALANNLIAAHGFKIGKSLADKASIGLAKSIISRHQNIILPVDAVVAKKIGSRNIGIKPINQIAKDEIILDIGPKTIRLFSGFIKKAATLVWNGPLGYFEDKHFKHGTLVIARVIAARSTGQAFGVAGGGETAAALKLTEMGYYMDWVSTGGGAMLAYLGGEKLPGLKGLVK